MDHGVRGRREDGEDVAECSTVSCVSRSGMFFDGNVNTNGERQEAAAPRKLCAGRLGVREGGVRFVVRDLLSFLAACKPPAPALPSPLSPGSLTFRSSISFFLPAFPLYLCLISLEVHVRSHDDRMIQQLFQLHAGIEISETRTGFWGEA